MKNTFKLFQALALVLLMTGPAFAWGGTGGDGTHYNQLRETAVFINNSGGTLTSGTVVILDTTETGVTLGSYMTTTTSADAITVLGVLKSDSVIDGAPGVVVTKGAAQALYAGATDKTTNIGDIVGTTTVVGQCGVGTNLGYALAIDPTGKTADYDLLWIWVNPNNGD